MGWVGVGMEGFWIEDEGRVFGWKIVKRSNLEGKIVIKRLKRMRNMGIFLFGGIFGLYLEGK